MKKSLFLIFFVCVLSYSQDSKISEKSEFQKLLKQNVTLLDSAKNQEEYEKVLFKFDRLEKLAKDEWLPLYYSVYCKVVLVRWKKGDDIITLLEEALQSIKIAKELHPKNSEILTLESRIYIRMVQENPMKNGPRYINLIKDNLNEAIKINEKNPRAYLTYGTFFWYFPSIVGGDKEKGCKMFNKAAAVYAESSNANNKLDAEKKILPHWGEILNAWYIKNNKCLEE